jgi:hypothetical protein
MPRVSQLAALALALAAAGRAAAAAPCPAADRGTLDEWKCFGEVRYVARDSELEDGARFVVFANGERLYERLRPGAAQSMLRGGDWHLFRGLTREDSTVIGAHHPFLFFEFALITPMVLLAASERPPSALPQGTTPVAHTLDSKPIELLREIGIRNVQARIERAGADYAFAGAFTGNVATGLLTVSVSGRWSSADVASWPDSMPLAGWQYGCKPAGPDVRNNHRPVPPGVTLGEVRRGWKGSCD